MSLSKDQESLLKLLLEVKKFMDSEGITFYLFGGSCIGALRHNGFIPWDNDVDIILDRNNYEKLLEATNHLPNEDIEFWSFEKHDDYFKPFGQFSSKKDTYFLKTRVFNKGLCMGTIIDVFVMDYVPSDKIEEHKKNLLLYEDVLGFYRLHRDEISEYKEKYFELIEREKTEGRRRVIEELQSKIEKYTAEESDLLVTRFWVKKLRQYKKEWFGEPRYCSFEGYMMPVPSNAEATLRLQYGYDWYRLPDEDLRLVHEFYANHEISNNNFVEDMEQFIEIDNVQELLEQRKHYAVERLQSRIEMRKVNDRLMLNRLLLEEKNNINNRNYEHLESIFEKMDLINQYEDIKAKLPLDFLADWTQWLIYAGRYYDAMKLITDNSNELLNNIVRIVEYYQDNDLDNLEIYINKFPKELQRKLPDVILSRVKIALSKKSVSEDLEGLLEDCEKYLEKYPQNFDIIKAKADMCSVLFRDDEAQKLYEIVKNNSRNGLDLLT